MEIDGACFIAGTLVHTNEGLVPIERLKMGDLVLSKPESGGEQAYKPVTRTVVHPDQEVLGVAYMMDDVTDILKAKFETIVCTYDHPFWVEECGWTAAERIDDDSWPKSPHFQRVDGSLAEAMTPKDIYATDQAGVGWFQVSNNDEPGCLWDFANERLIADQVVYDWDKWIVAGKRYVPFRTTVYNIEVEDYHTYFVGRRGVWVHNTNRT
jgi:hypothetical protein